jgi:hypothetical protein
MYPSMIGCHVTDARALNRYNAMQWHPIIYHARWDACCDSRCCVTLSTLRREIWLNWSQNTFVDHIAIMDNICGHVLIPTAEWGADIAAQQVQCRTVATP